MPTKKKTVYKTVPKPVKGIKKTIGCPVNCKECGTDDRFTLTAMLEHELWCAPSTDLVRTILLHVRLEVRYCSYSSAKH